MSEADRANDAALGRDERLRGEGVRRFYSDPSTVEFYSSYDTLTPAEQHLFATYVPPRSRVLDLGVGGGRTTKVLAESAAIYVGVDLEPRMVEACRSQFPHLDFHALDASDLSQFRDGSFDAVVFSFNGLDCLPTEALRQRCIAECARVLREGGVFIVSTHNPRCLFTTLDRSIVRRKSKALASRLRAQWMAAGINVVAVPAAWAVVNLRRWRHRLLRRGFWRGVGFLPDPLQPEQTLYAATPQIAEKEFAAAGFRTLCRIGGSYPRKPTTLGTDWFYFALQKT
ncbi:MAG: class I SAM-dependent methyltransferase [Candidatus Koribacter versatilis]|uniref:Class I SAM-dependent methyltransferase n=1 Tax=Candidatus Korobacter versatilis TaxID=658062 RepID=A0A932A7N0_9BACT|nr:class I SAM-dependent methyltransferase [Candidatus Koribacter versatilis]